MNIQNLKSLFIDNGCTKIYIKKLSPNDNSKNQVYFGGSFEILNILPISEIKNEEAGDWNKERFKASINLIITIKLIQKFKSHFINQKVKIQCILSFTFVQLNFKPLN
jgi:hypothetical protein